MIDTTRSVGRFLALGRMRDALKLCIEPPADASVADLRKTLGTVYRTSGISWRQVETLLRKADRGVTDEERCERLRAAIAAARRALTEKTAR